MKREPVFVRRNYRGNEELNRRLCSEWPGRRFLLQTFEADITEDQITESDTQAIRQLLEEDKEKKELPRRGTPQMHYETSLKRAIV